MKRYVKTSIFTAVAICCVAPLAGCSSAVDSEANKQLLNKRGKTSVTIFPTLIRRSDLTYDSVSAVAIGEYLKAEKLGEATCSADPIPIAGKWSHNQAKMFRQSANSLGDYVKNHALRTEYALMAEYLGGRDGAVGIHCYVVDTQGRLAAVVLLNSHWKVFADAKPKTPADCTKVLLAALKNEMKKR